MKFRFFRLSKILKRESGFYFVFLAGAFFALLAVMGFAVDMGMLQAAKLRLQRAVDASSVAATYLLDTKSRGEIETLATNLTKDNLLETGFEEDEIQDENDNWRVQITLEPATGVPRLVRVTAQAVPQLKILRFVPWIKTRPTISAEAQSNNVRVAVALVLDRSGSMGKPSPGPCGAGECPRIRELKRAARAFVQDGFGPDDRLAVVSFGTNATPDYHMTRNPDKEYVKNVIIGDPDVTPLDGLIPNGFTNTDAAMTLARNEMNSPVNSDLMPFDFKSIVVVTDGAPYNTAGGHVPSVKPGCLPGSSPLSNEIKGKRRYIGPLMVADQVRGEGVTVYAIGIGEQGIPDASPPYPVCNISDPFNPILQYRRDDPFQCWQNANDIVKNYFLARLTNDQEIMDGDLAASPPILADPDFPTDCVDDRLTIATKPRGRFFQTANPSDLEDLLLAIGRMIKARITK